jgi:hypothetical protein
MRAQADCLPAGVPVPGAPPVELRPERAPKLNFLRYGLNVLHRRKLARLAATDEAYQS